MMYKFAKWIASITLIILQLETKYPQVEAARGCDIKTTDTNKPLAVCSKRDLSEIPQDLKTDIVVLDISYNDYLALKTNDISKYTEITELQMSYITHPKEVTSDFFTTLNKLRVLDVSYSCLGVPFPKLPASLVNLKAGFIGQHCRLGEDSEKGLPDIADLVNLKNLTLRGNTLIDFPNLSAQPLLEIIDLSRNPLRDMNYSHLAPFCSLIEVSIYGTDLEKSDHEEQSCGIKQWAKERKIDLTGFAFQGTNCKKIEYDSKTLNVYNDCLKKIEKKSSISQYKIFLYALIVLGLLLALALLALLYVKYKATKKESTSSAGHRLQLFPNDEEEAAPESDELLIDELEVGEEAHVE